MVAWIALQALLCHSHGSAVADVKSFEASGENDAPRLMVPKPHSGAIFDVAESEELLATAAMDNTLRLWSKSSGRELKRLQFLSSISSVSFAPDRRLLAVESGAGVAHVFDRVGKPLIQYGSAKPHATDASQNLHVVEASWVGNSIFLVTLHGKVYRANGRDATLKPIGEGGGQHREALRAWISASGRWIASTATNQRLTVHDGTQGKVLFTAEASWGMRRVEFNEKESLVAIADPARGGTRICDLRGRVLSRAAAMDIVWSDEGKAAYYVADRELRRIRVGSWKDELVWRHSENLVTVVQGRDALLIGTSSGGLIRFKSGPSPIAQETLGAVGFVGAELGADELTGLLNDGGVFRTSRSESLPQILRAQTREPVGEALALPGMSSAILAGGRSARVLEDGSIRISSLQDGTVLSTIPSKVLRYRYEASSVRAGPGQQLLVTAQIEGIASGFAFVWSCTEHRVVQSFLHHTHWVHSGAWSASGALIATASHDQSTKVCRVVDGSVVLSLPSGMPDSCVAFSPGDMWLARGSWDGTVTLARLSGEGSRVTLRVIDSAIGYPTELQFSRDGTSLIVGATDGSVQIWNIGSAKRVARLAGHGSDVIALSLSPDGRRLVSVSDDGSMILSDLERHVEIARVDAGPSGWVCTTPQGWFDGSPDALKSLYWVLPDTLETIDLDQLKDRYWKPGLLAMVMRGERLSKAPDFPFNKLHPTVEVIPPKAGKTIAQVRLTPRSGGVGDVTLTVNGRPVALPKGAIRPRGVQDIPIDLAGFLVRGEEVRLEVRAGNADGSLTGRSIVAKVKPKAAKREAGDLFVLAVGVNRYGGDLRDLRFPGIDAIEFAKATQLAGKRLFKQVNVRVLAEGGSPFTAPTRAAIRNGFLWLQKSAGPEDTVLVFLAGHGSTVLKGGKSLYCFLTQGATGASLAENDMVTQDDLKGWTNPKVLRALRCAMVLDTCAAGELVEGMSARESDPQVVKLIDRAKDETGFWILAGSAADAASYETPAFGHGLLTYALLSALRGEGLDEHDGSAWIHTLFAKAKERVQREAGLCRIRQQPHIFAQSSPFPIGILDPAQREQIVLARPLPIVGRPKDFLDTTEQPFYDRLDLSSAIRSGLKDAFDVSPRGKVGFVYAENDNDPSAIVPSGTYRREAGQVIVSLMLLQRGKPVSLGGGVESVEVRGATREEAAARVVARVGELVAEIGGG